MVFGASGPLHRFGSEGERIPKETIFKVLKNSRRRYVLHYLKQREGPVSVNDLVDQVAAWENEKPITELTSKERQRLHVALLQTHLPMMDAADVIAYDSDQQLVDVSDVSKAIDIYIESIDKGDISWPGYYLGVTVLNAILIGIVWGDVYPFVLVPDSVWGVFVGAIFLLASLIHGQYHSRARLGSKSLSIH